MKYLRFSDLQQSDDATVGEYRGPKARFVRTLLRFLATLCQIDLYGGFIHRAHLNATKDQPNGTKIHAYKPADPKNETLERLRRVRQITWPAWSRLVRLFWLYCNIKILYSIIYEHNYVVYDHELRLLEAARAKHDSSYGSNKSTIEYEKYKMLRENTIVKLKLVGAPYYKWGPAYELLLIGLPFYVLLLYIGPTLVYSYLKPFDISIVRALCDPIDEQANHTNGRIWTHVNEYIKSCADYLRFQVRILSKISISSRNDANQYKLLVGRAIERLSSRQESITRQLKEHAIKGHLQPLNRNSNWLNITANWIIGYLLSIVSSNSIGGCAMLILIPRLDYKLMDIQTGPLDILFLIELQLYYALAVITAVLVTSIQSISVLDLGKFVLALCDKIDSTLEHNDKFITHFRRRERNNNKKQNNSSNNEELNMNVVIILVQVKMFCAELRAMRPVISLSATVVLTLMNAMPLFVKFYAHYMSKEMRLIGINLCLLTYYICDLVLLPNCYLYSRCLDLYRKLSSLLAHAIEINHTGSEVYDEHTIWLLRKELNWPEKLYEEFKTSTVIISLTYGSFLRMHFWFGIIMVVAMKSELGEHKSAYENIFGETLGILN